jgi:MYXO-CTERM domain-containing protein
VSCQSQCQEQSYPQCKNDFVKTCTTQCGQPEGALFCDGSYVDVGGDLTACVDALNTVLNAKITVTASGSSSCEGNNCTGNGTVKASCAASPSPASGGAIGALGAMLAMAVVGARRRAKR